PRDDFAGVTVHRARGNVLADPDGGGEWIELNPELSRGRTGAVELGLALLYRDAHRWLWVPYGETLQLLADGELMVLGGGGSLRSRRRSRLGGVEERVVYAVTPAQLRRLAAAESVRVRVVGRREYVERSFRPEGIARLREFVAAHLDAPPAPRPAPGGQ
ncbi:MAG TPA: hypothetical protein VHG51_16260, partial [Longimicrobiaceae bacterium]|nr:hypothetical protein [Longimicrobiaceae bacterium]